MSQPHIERRDRHTERLLQGLEKMSQRINQEFSAEIGADLVTSEGAVNMDAFAKKKNGPYRKTRDGKNPHDLGEDTIEADKAFVRGLEEEWAKEKVGARWDAPITDEILQQYRESRLKSPGMKLEMAVTLLFHKLLSSEFLVLRTAPLDDYKHKADHIMIERATGAVVCSFNELSELAFGGGANAQKKMEDVFEVAAQNGSTLKYGVTFAGPEGGKKLVREPLKNVPLFALIVPEETLRDLLEEMDPDPTAACTPKESEVFTMLMAALEKQRAELDELHLPREVVSRLEMFKHSLQRMKDLVKAH